MREAGEGRKRASCAQRLADAKSKRENTRVSLSSLRHLQLPITRGQDCQSIGKLRNIIGHLALIVNLEIQLQND